MKKLVQPLKPWGRLVLIISPLLLSSICLGQKDTINHEDKSITDLIQTNKTIVYVKNGVVPDFTMILIINPDSSFAFEWQKEIDFDFANGSFKLSQDSSFIVTQDIEITKSLVSKKNESGFRWTYRAIPINKAKWSFRFVSRTEIEFTREFKGRTYKYILKEEK